MFALVSQFETTIPYFDNIILTVFGWLNDSFTGAEQEESHVIQVGYQKGADQVGYTNIFNLIQQSPAGNN